VRTPLLAALITLSLAAPAATSEARADDGKGDAPAAPGKSEDASQRFKSGVAFYKDKDFTAALVEFKRAYELLPNYNVLYNLGQTARELKDYAAALTAFEQYLRDGGAKIGPARRKEVAAAVDELRRKVGKLRVVISVDGAEIVLDDVRVGVSPLAEPLVVNAGRRKLSAQASGHTPAQRVVDVAATEETAVTLDLPAIDSGPKQVEPPPPPKAATPLAAWVALGGTGAAAVAAGVTGGLALSAHSTLEHALGTFPGSASAIGSAQSKTRTLAVTTDVLIGLTAAGAATTVVFFVVIPRLPEKASVGVSPTGIVARGVF
jgi:hypothetical protein